MSVELFNKAIEPMKALTDLQPELNMHFASLPPVFISTPLNWQDWHKIESGDPIESHINQTKTKGNKMAITSQQLYVLGKLAKVNNETDEFAHLTDTEDPQILNACLIYQYST